jgi:hypothetical protein
MLALQAYGQLAVTGAAQAQSRTAATPGASPADRTSILRSMKIVADSRGQVENDCGERVTPRFQSADMGGAVGTAVLFVMEGGPNTASCYGDGPGLILLKREGAGWREIYSSRGGYMAILKTMHGGVRDIAFAGPGFQHPLWTWNGARFAPSKSTVSDAQTSSATILP